MEGGCFLGESSLKSRLAGLWLFGELKFGCQTAVFLSSHKLPKTLPVSTLPLFGPLLSEAWHRLIYSHRYGLPLLHLWYYLWIRAAAKFHPSPRHLKLSQRGACCELAQDPPSQRAVWMGLMNLAFTAFISCTCMSCCNRWVRPPTTPQPDMHGVRDCSSQLAALILFVITLYLQKL